MARWWRWVILQLSSAHYLLVTGNLAGTATVNETAAVFVIAAALKSEVLKIKLRLRDADLRNKRRLGREY